MKVKEKEIGEKMSLRREMEKGKKMELVRGKKICLEKFPECQDRTMSFFRAAFSPNGLINWSL